MVAARCRVERVGGLVAVLAPLAFGRLLVDRFILGQRVAAALSLARTLARRRLGAAVLRRFLAVERLARRAGRNGFGAHVGWTQIAGFSLRHGMSLRGDG